MRVYLAGRINGDPDYHDKFAKAADKLRSEGWEVFNPAAANQEGRPLPDIMAHVLSQLCQCQAIAFLPCWVLSGGCRVEFELAQYLGIEVIRL